MIRWLRSLAARTGGGRIDVRRTRLRPPLGGEMAEDPDFYWGFGDFGEEEHPSVILRTRSKHYQDLGELYDEMERKDADLRGLQRKLDDSVLALPWWVVPAGSGTAEREGAKLCHYVLSRFNRQSCLRHQLQATPRGIAFSELLWEELKRGPFAGAWVPVTMTSPPMARFGFQQKILHVRRPEGLVRPPPAKILMHRQGNTTSSWGDPLWDSLYWPYWLKLHGQEYWALLLERWAAPITVAKWRRRSGDDAEEENRKLAAAALTAAKEVWGGSALSMPDDVLVELYEAKRSGNVSFADFCSAQTRKMALVVQGEVQTSGLRPGVGAYASERISMEIRTEKRDLAASSLVDQIQTLFDWVVDVNYGPQVVPPLMVMDVLDQDEQEALMAGIDRALELNRHLPEGQRIAIPVSHLRRAWRIPAPIGSEPFVTVGAVDGGEKGVSQ